jgi:predicted Zn-dependent protease
VRFEPRDPREDVNVTPGHPLGEAFWLVAALGLVGVLLALMGFALVEIAVRFVPPDLEAKGLAAIAPDAAAIDDPRAADVQSLLDRLARHWPENPYRLRAGVLEEASENALALPGGMVLVTTGLLERVESENELAFVLGHELGHFRGRDHLRALGRGAVVGLVMAALGLGGSSVELPRLAASLAESGFGRAQEEAADRFGLALVLREYGHAGGASDFFRRLPDAEADVPSRLRSYLATHPVTEDRLASLAREIASAGAPSDGARVALPESFRR